MDDVQSQSPALSAFRTPGLALCCPPSAGRRWLSPAEAPATRGAALDVVLLRPESLHLGTITGICIFNSLERNVLTVRRVFGNSGGEKNTRK